MVVSNMGLQATPPPRSNGIKIQQSKGKKGRYTLLPKKTLITLRKYFKEYKPQEWLFDGEGGGHT